MKLKILILFILFSSAFSCAKEEIESFANPITLAEQRGQDPELTIITGGFKFDDIDISTPVGDIPIPILGSFIREFANSFANLFLVLANNWDIEQDAPFIEIPKMDLSLIDSIQITNLDLKIIPGSTIRSKNPAVRFYQWLTFKKAKLDFIRTINIYLTSDKLLKTDNKILLASYDFKEQKLECESKCLKFNMLKESSEDNINLKHLIENSSKIYIIPKIEIKSAPKRRFKLNGNIDYKIKFRLPF